jgi:hypothetical protein
LVFGVANFIDRESQADVIDGIMGIGFPRKGEPQSLLNKAVADGTLDKPVYTVILDKVGGDNHKPGGEIVFGELLDEARCSPTINYAPLVSTDYWTILTQKVMIGKQV